MDDGSRLSMTPWLIAVVLLLLAAYFAVTETAIASVSRSKIKAKAERGDPRAEKAQDVLEHFDQAVTTLLICTNIVHIAAAAIVTVAVTARWGLSAVSVSTLITTIVVFFVGEMLPKSIAKSYSERFTLSNAGTLRTLMTVFTPLSAALTAIGQAAARLTPGDPEISVTEDELYDLIEDMTEEGTLDEEQGDLISSALQFGDVTVESILTPRVDLAAIDIEDSPEEILAQIKAQNHSRLPVYEGSIDNIIGILQIRKYIKAYLHLGSAIDLRPLLDEALFIHQSTNIDELLPIMAKSKKNIAIVTDNYGGTLGIVTVEDILEELVGEIWDEEDVVVEPCVDNGDGSDSFDASVDLGDALEFMDREEPDEPELAHKLLSAWTYEQFDHLPQVGDSFVYEGLRVSVQELDQRRIRKLRIEPLPAEQGEEAESS